MPPILEYVTVDPETGYDSIVWTPSPTSSVTYHIVYMLYRTSPDHVSNIMIEDQVMLPQTFYNNLNSDSNIGSVGYQISAAINNGGGVSFEEFSRIDSTIFLQSVFDSCLATITLTWNDYNSWRGLIAEYNIYRKLAPFIYERLETVSEGTETVELTNIDANQTYDLFVEAVHIDGRKSTSNIASVLTTMTQQPGFVNADYATISPGNFIDLSFTVDGVSSLTHYFLMRGTSLGGPFTQIASFETSDIQIRYTDETAFASNVYFYRLDIMNNCGEPSSQTNLSNNIILRGTQADRTINLFWNEYYDWAGGVDEYRIIRSRGRENPVIDTLSSFLSTEFIDDISLLGNYENPTSSLICYEVKATENMNVYGIQGHSTSNRVCFTVNPEIRMPNAFIPNDTEPLNQVFEPVFSFEPEHYDMIIYNRLGTRIWEGSQAWDGQVNGKYVPEGVYLYYLRVFNFSTDIIELNGKVTVVYR